MANIYRKSFARGTAGTFGERSIAHQTFSGKTILTQAPLFDDQREHLESLNGHQAALLEATTYASFAKTEDIYLQKELETGMSAYSLALADWLGAPRILQINVDRWTGSAGQIIRVKARDNMRVERVALVIRGAKGDLLETGEAVQTEADSPWWCYTTQTSIPLTPFPSVQAIAQDLPGNSVSFTIC